MSWGLIFDRYAIPLKDMGYYINYPCFHPEIPVFRPPIVQSRDEFVNIKVDNPANIEASVMYIKFPDQFEKRNVQLAKMYEDDCSICLEPLNNNELIYYPCHVFHVKCIIQCKQCPLCQKPITRKQALQRQGIKYIHLSSNIIVVEDMKDF